MPATLRAAGVTHSHMGRAHMPGELPVTTKINVNSALSNYKTAQNRRDRRNRNIKRTNRFVYPTGVKAPAPEIAKHFNPKYLHNMSPEEYKNMELLFDFQGMIGYPTLDQRDPFLCHSAAPWPTLPIPRPDMYTRVKTPKAHGTAWVSWKSARRPGYIAARPGEGFHAVSGDLLE